MDRKDAALALVVGALVAIVAVMWDNVIETLMDHERRITEQEGHDDGTE